MGILCSIGRHEAEPSRMWNAGFYFSRCRHCEIDMIRQSRNWRPVPKGYEVIWKPRTEQDMDWSALCAGSLKESIRRH